MKRFYLSILRGGGGAAIALVAGALLAPLAAGDNLDVVEGNTLTIEVKLPPHPNSQFQHVPWNHCNASYDWSTEDGTALSGTDYREKSGTLTFSSGTEIRQIQVETLENNCTEPDETFSVVVNNRKWTSVLGTTNYCVDNSQHLWKEKTFRVTIEDDGAGAYAAGSYEAQHYGCSLSSGGSTFGE